MIKKFFILCIALFVSLFSSAQNKAGFGVQVELGLSGIGGDMNELFGTDDFNLHTFIGIKMTLFSEIHVYKSLFIEPGVSYAEKGFRAKYITFKEEITPIYITKTTANSEVEVNVNYVQFPIRFKYKYKFIAFACGFYYSRLSDARIEQVSTIKIENTDRYFNNTYDIHKNAYYSSTDLHNFKRDVYGIITGIEFEFPFGASIIAFYERGLTSIFTTEITSSKITNVTWLFGAKYKLIKNKKVH